MVGHIITYKESYALPDPSAIPIFGHIPKYGGSTLINMLKKIYGVKMDFTNHGSILDLKFRPDIVVYASHDVSIIHHLLEQWQTCFYFTFIRHPILLAISSYKFNKFYCQISLT